MRWNRDEPYRRPNRDQPKRLETRPDQTIPKYILSISPLEMVLAMKDLGNAVRWPSKMVTLPDNMTNASGVSSTLTMGIEPTNASP